MAKKDVASQQVKTKKELLRERLSSKYPEENFDDDENLASKISDDYDAHDEEIGQYKQREQALSDMFNSDPRSASFLTSWRNGEDPVIQMIRRYGDNFKDALNDPEKLSLIENANKEYIDRVEQEKGFEEEYNNNITASLQSIDEMQQKNGIEDSDVDNAIEWLVNLSHDVLMGKFTPELLDMAFKAINHDKDVAEAQHEGEVQGRNDQIDLRMKHGRRNDGTQGAAGGANGVAGRIIRPQGNDGNKNIWERGGEKRIVRNKL